MSDIEEIQREIQKHVNKLRKSASHIGLWAEEEDEIDGDLCSLMLDEVEGMVIALNGIDGQLDELLEYDGGNLDDLARLHEAICEGRKQDAIDMLSGMFPDASFRSVADQNFLFPYRVVK